MKTITSGLVGVDEGLHKVIVSYYWMLYKVNKFVW